MEYVAIDFAEKCGLFAEDWKPKVIAEMNNYQFKLAKIRACLESQSGRDAEDEFDEDCEQAHA